MDLKEMLESGYSAEELRKEFEDELKEAQDAVAASQKKEIDKAELEDARSELVDAIFEYVLALGLLDDEDVDEKLYKSIEEAFEEYEQEIEEFTDLLSKMKIHKSEKHIKDPDAVIKTFIATL